MAMKTEKQRLANLLQVSPVEAIICPASLDVDCTGTLAIKPESQGGPLPNRHIGCTGDPMHVFKKLDLMRLELRYTTEEKRCP